MRNTKISLTIGEWNLCIFPICLLFGEAVTKDGIRGETISIGFLKWAITFYIWRVSNV